MLAPLAVHRLRRFFGGSVLPCHSVTANRSRISDPTRTYSILSPHALSQTPRLYSQPSSMHPTLSQLSTLTFSQNRNRMHQLPLAQYISTSSFNPGPLRGPSYLYMSFVGCTGVHQPLTWPQGRPKAPPRHAVALLRPPPLFTRSPRLANIFSSTCLLLPCSKKDTKTTKQQRKLLLLSLSLSLALWAAVGS